MAKRVTNKDILDMQYFSAEKVSILQMELDYMQEQIKSLILRIDAILLESKPKKPTRSKRK